jgi:hypothetical protein
MAFVCRRAGRACDRPRMPPERRMVGICRHARARVLYYLRRAIGFVAHMKWRGRLHRRARQQCRKMLNSNLDNSEKLPSRAQPQ